MCRKKTTNLGSPHIGTVTYIACQKFHDFSSVKFQNVDFLVGMKHGIGNIFRYFEAFRSRLKTDPISASEVSARVFGAVYLIYI